MRGRRSPALFVAVLVLIAAVAGTALAGSGPGADSSSVKKDTKKALKLAKKNKKAIKSIELTPGAKGEKGDTGQGGQTGGPGEPGSDAASLLTGVISPLGFTSETRFATPSGSAVPQISEFSAATLSPNAVIVAQDLAVVVDPPGGSETLDFTLRVNGVDTGVTCRVMGPSNNCNSGAATHSVPARSEISIGITASAGPTSTTAKVGWRAAGP